MDKLKVHCCIPDYKAFVSGGNIYNELLFNASNGNQVSFHFDINKLPPFKKDDLVFVDTLFMESFLNLSFRGASKAILIVHHLESLYPAAGFDPEREIALLNNFDGFLVSSDFTKFYLIEKGFSSDDIFVIRPISSTTFDSLKRDTKHPLKVLLVANLIERKGLIEFFEALEKTLNFKNEMPAMEINIAGGDSIDVDYARRLKAFIDHSSLKNFVKFHGEVDPSKMDKLYNQNHVFISVAKMETFGMAIQEAALAGLCILALERGAVTDHIDNNSILGFENMVDLIQDLLDLTKAENKLINRLEMAALKVKQFPERTWLEEYRKMISFFKN
jgi:glycosyltransferase involved in cell wall biosynthesis